MPTQRIEPPRGLVYSPIDSTSVLIQWTPASQEVEGYEVRGGGSHLSRVVNSPRTSTIIRGLTPARRSIIEVRAFADGQESEWSGIQVRPSFPIPSANTSAASVVQVIDADRQSVQMRLPRADGSVEDVKLSLWWSPSDSGWWGSLEVPVNTPVIRSRSLPLNAGLLDDVEGVLAGNIVMRATALDDESEPNRMSFVNQTHELHWEPN